MVIFNPLIYRTNMITAEYFRKALWDYLDGEPRGAQTKLAKGSEISRIHLNDFLAGRRAMKESFRLKITDYLGVDYLDFLQKGRDLIAGKSPGTGTNRQHVITLDDKHINVTKKFKKKTGP